MKICPWQQHHLAPVYRQVPGIVCFVRGKYPWKHPTDVTHVQSPSLSRSSRQTRSMYECQKTAIFLRRLRGTVQEVVGTSVKRARHRGHLKWCQGKLCPSHLRQPGRHPSCSHPFIPWNISYEVVASPPWRYCGLAWPGCTDDLLLRRYWSCSNNASFNEDVWQSSIPKPLSNDS